MARVTVDLSPLRKFAQAIHNDLQRKGSGPIRKAVKQWAARFRAATRKRFVLMSKSGWKRLKRKRKRGSLEKANPLRDTGTLLNVLDTQFANKPGQLEKHIPFGVRVGYGGPSAHPKGATVAQIAEWHQTGAGRLPVREIIVGLDELPPNVTAGMARDMENALKALADGS